MKVNFPFFWAINTLSYLLLYWSIYTIPFIRVWCIYYSCVVIQELSWEFESGTLRFWILLGRANKVIHPLLYGDIPTRDIDTILTESQWTKLDWTHVANRVAHEKCFSFVSVPRKIMPPNKQGTTIASALSNLWTPILKKKT